MGIVERRRLFGGTKVGTSQKDMSISLSPKSGRSRRQSIRRTCLIYLLFLSVAITFTWTFRRDLFLKYLSFKKNGDRGGACLGYDGVLHIAQGDAEGAAGTIFFLFVINQLIYADKHNLVAFIHLSDVSKYVYDPIIHGSSPVEAAIVRGFNASWVNYVDPISKNRFPFPGRPVQVQKSLTQETYTIHGSGVWNDYFEPVSNFSFNDISCTSLPLIRLTEKQIIPGLHLFCPWSLRAWRYGGMPEGLRRDDLSYQDWFSPMRQRGSQLVHRYIRVKPYLIDLVDQAMKRSVTNQRCLALHIRHSDKANRRKRIPVKAFLPYVQAYIGEHSDSGYVRNSSFPSIYLATDSQRVVHEIQTTWPVDVVAHMRWQTAIVRSNDTTPVFTLTSSRHATNVQVLVDILAMSRCQHMLHGLSAVSEASHYFNPLLHNRSINLEVLERSKKKSQILVFRQMVREALINNP